MTGKRGQQPVANLYLFKALPLDRLLANDREEGHQPVANLYFFKALLLDRLLANDMEGGGAATSC